MMMDDTSSIVLATAFAFYRVDIDHEIAQLITDRIAGKDGELEELVRDELVLLGLLK